MKAVDHGLWLRESPDEFSPPFSLLLPSTAWQFPFINYPSCLLPSPSHFKISFFCEGVMLHGRKLSKINRYRVGVKKIHYVDRFLVFCPLHGYRCCLNGCVFLDGPIQNERLQHFDRSEIESVLLWLFHRENSFLKDIPRVVVSVLILFI